VTPYEHHTLESPHHATPIVGEDAHDFSHFDQGFWDLKGHEPHLGDHGHFAGEEHGMYHYVDRGVDGHHGTYYSYMDEQEHHPAHTSDYHSAFGVEHHPDDWITDVHHPEVFVGGAHYDPSHHTYYPADHFGEHHYDDHHLPHDYHHTDAHHPHYSGDGYNHDSDYHFGTKMVHDIEHSYDDLFHDLESQFHHGVEHHETEYTSLPH
jgi:hypothetical protein